MYLGGGSRLENLSQGWGDCGDCVIVGLTAKTHKQVERFLSKFPVNSLAKRAGVVSSDCLLPAILRGGFCDSRDAVVHKVLEGLTQFNTLSKARFGWPTGPTAIFAFDFGKN